MTKWVNAGGYYVVASTKEVSKEEFQRRMDELEEKLREAEKYFAMKKQTMGKVIVQSVADIA